MSGGKKKLCNKKNAAFLVHLMIRNLKFEPQLHYNGLMQSMNLGIEIHPFQ